VPTQRQTERAAIVEQVAHAVASCDLGLAPPRRGLFEAFCAEVSRQLRAPFVARCGERLPQELFHLFELMERRRPGQILVDAESQAGGELVLRTVMADQPFIVDTVRLVLGTKGGGYTAGFNAVVRVSRDGEGALVAVGDGELESVLQIRDAIVRYLGVGRGSRLLPAIWAIEDRVSVEESDQVAAGILRTRYFALLRRLVGATSLASELRLGGDRVSHKLYYGPLGGIAAMVDAIVGHSPSVGALLVAEERLRAAVLS